MSQTTHIINHDGEVVIVLLNANLPFAGIVDLSSSPPEYGSETQSSVSENTEVTDDPNSPDLSAETKKKIGEQGILQHPSASDAPSLYDNAAECPADDSPTVYIQVSAKHMMLASPVFKAMLTSGWKESAQFSQKGYVERNLTLEMLAKVAVIADFYGCKEALHVMADIWVTGLQENIPDEYCRDLVLWVWISWFFELPSYFEHSTALAIVQSEGPINGWGLPIPKGVLGMMNEGRQGPTGNLLQCLRRLKKALLSRQWR
ncbi:hypothetical protein N7452_010901 [Penicillium brevicompactum]|uniref:BTB domain-containing protein n=1 Tax=Penicillium brevicompactum TaxID=5074 RepID=A0A9W9Q4E0_PENBR|nr:hypothetical protein N7452_010901 [Penicillium brevicompactum]